MIYCLPVWAGSNYHESNSITCYLSFPWPGRPGWSRQLPACSGSVHTGLTALGTLPLRDSALPILPCLSSFSSLFLLSLRVGTMLMLLYPVALRKSSCYLISRYWLFLRSPNLSMLGAPLPLILGTGSAAPGFRNMAPLGWPWENVFILLRLFWRVQNYLYHDLRFCNKHF